MLLKKSDKTNGGNQEKKPRLKPRRHRRRKKAVDVQPTESPIKFEDSVETVKHVEDKKEENCKRKHEECDELCPNEDVSKPKKKRKRKKKTVCVQPAESLVKFEDSVDTVKHSEGKKDENLKRNEGEELCDNEGLSKPKKKRKPRKKRKKLSENWKDNDFLNFFENKLQDVNSAKESEPVVGLLKSKLGTLYDQAMHEDTDATSQDRLADWRCVECETINFSSRCRCYKCKADRPYSQGGLYVQTSKATCGFEGRMEMQNLSLDVTESVIREFFCPLELSSVRVIAGKVKSKAYILFNSQDDAVLAMEKDDEELLGRKVGLLLDTPVQEVGEAEDEATDVIDKDTGEWKCGNPKCSRNNFERRLVCRRCKTPRFKDIIEMCSGSAGGEGKKFVLDRVMLSVLSAARSNTLSVTSLQQSVLTQYNTLGGDSSGAWSTQDLSDKVMHKINTDHKYKLTGEHVQLLKYNGVKYK